jgi:hypothetical protein
VEPIAIDRLCWISFYCSPRGFGQSRKDPARPSAAKSDFPCSIVRPTAASAIAGFSLSTPEGGRSLTAPDDPPHRSVGQKTAKIYKTVEEDA